MSFTCNRCDGRGTYYRLYDRSRWRCAYCKGTGLLKAAGEHDSPVQAAVASGQEQTDNPGQNSCVNHLGSAGESVREKGT